MGLEPSEAVVLVPAQFDSALSVCTAADFLARLEDGESFEDARDNSAIDTITPTVEEFARVLALNLTGDAAAYWEPS